MAGLIGVPCNESARFSETYASLCGLHLPPDWVTAPDGSCRMPVLQCRFASLAASLNFIGQLFLRAGPEFQWLFLTNDDHIYPPDTVLRLLSHGKDYVTGLYLKKQTPFDPILYDRIEPDGTLHPRRLRDEDSGLIPIVASGDGCLLLSRRVLETIPQPWWEMSTPFTPDLITQDLIFCRKVREAGFEMWCDLDVTPGHLAITPVRAQKIDGVWRTVLASGPSESILLPQPEEQREEAVSGIE